MDLGLKDKVVVIMGGTSGVGLSTAQRFLEEGSKVAICGRDPERLKDALSTLEPYGKDRVFGMTCDVVVEPEVLQFVKASVETFGGIDVLVNSAGRSIMGHFFDINNDQWMEQLQLKFYAIIYAVRAVHPYMVKRGGGRIININANLAKEPEPHMVATAAARAGLLNLSKSLAHEFATDNILVNSVSLGLIKSAQWDKRREKQAPDADPDKWYAELAKIRQIPLGRVGKPEEVASAIAFFASEHASYISGSCVEVAGGYGRAL